MPAGGGPRGGGGGGGGAAEGVGFDPTGPVKGQRFSRPPLSTAQPPLRGSLRERILAVRRHRTMRAAEWEFRHRFWVYFAIFGGAFGCYAFDHTNVIAWLVRTARGPVPGARGLAGHPDRAPPLR